MSQNQCILCKFDLLSAPRAADYRRNIECPHCGNYMIDRDAFDDWPDYSRKKPELGHILSHLTRRFQLTTDKKWAWAYINSNKIEKIIETGSLPTPQEQAEYLLHWLGTNLTGPGELTEITWKTHGAIIGAKSSNGFDFSDGSKITFHSFN